MVRRLYFAVVLLLSVAPAFSKPPAFELRKCSAAAVAVGARCGVIQVPENPARPSGRQIALNVIVLPSIGSAREAKRAQYDLEGGPGFAATDFLEFYAGDGAVYRQSSDIVLADMRGAGQSHPLRCTGIEQFEKQQPASLMYPRELVAACARQLQVASDPRQYNTANAARDIDLVRQALGYEQLDLNAISYGTTLALRYMADFPQRVHSAVLMGTVPASRTPPRFHAPAAHAAFERVVIDCAADLACKSKFGDVRAHLDAALKRLETDQTLPRSVFLEKLRTRLYSPMSRAGIPRLLSLAAGGDFGEFTKAGGDQRRFADGLYLSITCSESFANMDVPAAIAASRATLFSAYRLERQADACRHWPFAPAKITATKPSNIPVLFIAGELDPVSPAEWAQETATLFANSKLVRVARGAHVLDGLSDLDTCLDAVVLRFFDSGDAQDLDTSCFERMTPPPFLAGKPVLQTRQRLELSAVTPGGPGLVSRAGPDGPVPGRGPDATGCRCGDHRHPGHRGDLGDPFLRPGSRPAGRRATRALKPGAAAVSPRAAAHHHRTKGCRIPCLHPRGWIRLAHPPKVQCPALLS